MYTSLAIWLDYIFLFSSYAWILQDILGIAFCISLVKAIRLPNLKVCTILLVLLLIYDIFFVFITPLFSASHKSVMVQVATGETQSWSDLIFSQCLNWKTMHACHPLGQMFTNLVFLNAHCELMVDQILILLIFIFSAHTCTYHTFSIVYFRFLLYYCITIYYCYCY